MDLDTSRPISSEDPNVPIFIDWERPYDPGNPFDWTTAKKWRLTFAAFYFTLLSCVASTAYPAAAPVASAALGCSEEVYLLGNMTFLVALAIGPMVLAPVSEVYGRRPVYVTAAICFVLLQVPLSLAVNVEMLIVFRALEGFAASAGNSMVGGSIADAFPPSSRGLPMGVFTFLTFVGSALGPIVASLILTTSASWRWQFYWQLIFCAPAVPTSILFLHETRGSLLLAKRAATLTRETGRLHRAVGDEDAKARANFGVMVKTSLVRPFVFLLTEPIVIAMSLWMSFAWGAVFLLVESIPLVFAQYPQFQPATTGAALIFLVTAIGGAVGFATNFHQDYLYARAVGTSGDKGSPKPEMRLPWACIGGVLFPIGMLWYAWAGRPPTPWPVPALGLILTYAGISPIYLTSYSYLADVYESYASSALSAASLLRNVLGGIFILIAKKLYQNLRPGGNGAGDDGLGYAEASTLLVGVAAALGVVPFWLWWWGEGVRRRSRIAMRIARERAETETRAGVEAVRRESGAGSGREMQAIGGSVRAMVQSHREEV